MKKLLLIVLTLTALVFVPVQAQKYVGGDISMLTKYENANKTYRTKSGSSISDLITYCKQQGWNSMRVRLFVNPTGAYADGTACNDVCQDLNYVKVLGKRIKDAGLNFLLDFHYSDTYADPSDQWSPSAWASLSNTNLYTQIKSYTEEVLQTLIDYGATPDAIQIGNEISYGMCWGTYNTKTYVCYTGSSSSNWTRFTTLLSKASEACRSKCPNAQIILHTERVPQTNVLTNFYDKMASAGVDYDIIGLSYYPQYHGSSAKDFTTLGTALSTLQTRYPSKNIWIVETAYSANGYDIPSPTYDYSTKYPFTDTGQNNYTQALIDKLHEYTNVKGLFWWFAEDNPYGNSTSVRSSGDGWWNGSLFDQSTGKARTALTTLANFDDGETAGDDDDDDEFAIYINTNGGSAPYVHVYTTDWSVHSTYGPLTTTKTVSGTSYYYLSLEDFCTTNSCSAVNLIFNNGSWGSGNQTGNLLNVSQTTYYMLDTSTYTITDSFTDGGTVYTIVGSQEITGANWDVGNDTDNASRNMAKSGSTTYTLTLTNMPIRAGWYSYKVVGDHSYDTYQYPSGTDNQWVEVPADGYYTVAFSFDSSGPTLTCTLTKTAELSITGYDIVGDQALMGSDWAFDHEMTDNNDGTYTLVLTTPTLTAGTTYNFKAAANDAWGISEYPSSGNQTLTVPVDGVYQITFTLDTSLSNSEALTVSQKALMLDISSALYSTVYYSATPLVIPTGVTAYTYKFDTSGQLVVSHTYTSGSVVPAGTAVVIYSPTATTYPFALTDDEGTADNNSHLKGTDTATLTTGGARYYKLSLDASQTPGTLGWYWGADNGAAFTNGAHKAYLCLPTSMASQVSASHFSLGGETTAIDAITTDNGTATQAVYTIDGRRIKPSATAEKLPKGVYIRGGKKVVVK